MEWFKTLKNTLKNGRSIPSGTVTGTCFTQEHKPYKLLLKVEENGHGRLVVNAHTILFLNPTSTEYIYHFIRNQYGDDVVAYMQAKYRIGRSEVLQDYEKLVGEIEGLLDEQDLSPLTNLRGFTNESDGAKVPVKMDLYPQLNAKVPAARDLAWWKDLMRRARDEGVAHFVLVGGEPLEWSGVKELISTSEELGVVMGLVTSQNPLSLPMLDQLIESGLDHISIMVPEKGSPNWALLKEVSDRNLFLQVVFEVSNTSIQHVKEALKQASSFGIKNVAFEAMAKMEQSNLDDLFDLTDASGLQFVPFTEMVCRDGKGADLERFADHGSDERTATIVLPSGEIRSLANGEWKKVTTFLN